MLFEQNKTDEQATTSFIKPDEAAFHACSFSPFKSKLELIFYFS